PTATGLCNHLLSYSRLSREGAGGLLHTSITIGYDVPWPQVHDLLLGAARGVDGLLATPEPFVLQTSLGDFSVAYELNAYTHEVTRMARLYSEMHRRIQDAFAEAGIEILSPAYHARRDAPSTVPDPAYLRDLASGDGGSAPEA
ncbi:MAG: mechanosensitive ion channel family protein, partial [Bacteroidota bacterium]